jgi:hypothetical protein
MAVAGDTATPVGAMPKVEGLTATAGDAEGTIGLARNAIPRGLQNFLIELTEDPAGQTGWRLATNSRKSSAVITGLTSGQRYWLCVTTEGAAGPGPASNPATKVAPQSRTKASTDAAQFAIPTPVNRGRYWRVAWWSVPVLARFRRRTAPAQENKGLITVG